MTKPFIVELNGRLGNQLFEFAAGYALALDHGTELTFFPAMIREEDNSLRALLGPLYRESSFTDTLRFGRIGGEPISLTGKRHSRRHLLDLIGRSAGDVLKKRPGWPHIVGNEVMARFEPHVLEARPGSLLVGLFQSEQYFARHADAVAAAILLPEVPTSFDALPRPIVGVSFRRGDYTERNWTLSLDYYERAMREMVQEVTPASIVVFSDDDAFSQLATRWLQQFGSAHYASTFGQGPMAEFTMLAHCDHHVVANSTFAWWGAWLAERTRRPRYPHYVRPGRMGPRGVRHHPGAMAHHSSMNASTAEPSQ